MLLSRRMLSRLAAPRMLRTLECLGRPAGHLAASWGSPSAPGCLHLRSAAMCTKADKPAGQPAGKRQFLELPSLSTSRERVQNNGLIALTAPYIRQQNEGGKAMETSFRVQTYTVPLRKPAEFALTSVFGFGRVRSKQVAAETGLYGHYPLSRMRESQRSFIKRKLSNACIAYDDPGAFCLVCYLSIIYLSLPRVAERRLQPMRKTVLLALGRRGRRRHSPAMLLGLRGHRMLCV